MKMCGLHTPHCVLFLVVAVVFTLISDRGLVAAHSRYRRNYWRRSYLEVVTFNTGLHVSDVPKYENRRDAFLGAMTNGDIPGDVVCLQEVWEADDLHDVVNAARSRFPHSYSALHTSDGVLSNPTPTPACDPARMSSLVQCLTTNCISFSGIQAVVCALTTCKSDFSSQPQNCMSCLSRILASSQLATITLTDFQLRIQTCLATPYQTTFGLLLLSKKPLRDPEIVNYHQGSSLFLPRGYIKAKVDIYHIYCTHLVSELSQDIYIEVGPFTSFKDQSLFEIESLLNASNANYYQNILVGDFNSSPSITKTNITGFLTDTYDLVSEFYDSLYLRRIGKCTFCEENPLVRSRGNKLYDHVFVPNNFWWIWLRVEGVKRVLDSTISNKTYPFSDHYGISLTLRGPYTWIWWG